MLMAVMELRDVGMIMHQRQVAVQVSMWLLHPLRHFMLMVMVLDMHMYMVMFQFLMQVEMAMMSSEKEYDAHPHDQSRYHLHGSPALTENGNSSERADKGSSRKESGLPSGTMQTKSLQIQHQAHAIAKKAQHKRGEDNRRLRQGLTTQNSQIQCTEPRT